MKPGKTNKIPRTIANPAAGTNLKTVSGNAGNWTRLRIGGLLAVLATSLLLNCIGLSWGRSGLVPWSPDSIEGITTVREMQRMFGQWKYKYPRGHFLVNAIFYHPLLKNWEKHPVRVGTADGRIVSQTLNLERLDTLAKISRVISATMGTATALAVFLTVMWLFGDYMGALLAALALALSQTFVFYSHVGNVDVPCVFWFAWGIYWAVKAIYLGKWRHFVLMGLCFSLSICSKDAVGGYLAGTALAFWLTMIGKARADGQSSKTAVLAVFSKKVLVAVLVFLFFYALLQDILTSPQAFTERMSIWIGGRGVAGGDSGFTGELPLLWRALQMLPSSLGWPLLAMAIISLSYCTIKYPWQLGFTIIPLVAFYVIVVMSIHMVFPRYFLPAYTGFAMLIGKGCADWLRYRKIHIAMRVFPVALVYTLSLLYCIGLDLEMLTDTRARTEQWFYKNVTRDNIIGAGIYNKIYAPRLHLNGYRLICPWRASEQGVLYPEYLIMPPAWPRTPDKAEDEFRKKLFNGQLDYEQVASFKTKYLRQGTIFGFVGWPSWLNPESSRVSPEMIVFKKKAKGTSKAGQTPGPNITK